MWIQWWCTGLLQWVVLVRCRHLAAREDGLKCGEHARLWLSHRSCPWFRMLEDDASKDYEAY